MFPKLVALILLTGLQLFANAQCFLVPSEVCVGDCGPLFYLQDDPDGTTYQWSISCGTITNENSANPHVVCFNSSGTCTISVIIEVPGELPDTCTMTVEVLAPSLSVVVESICEGDSIEINGMYYSEGFFTDTIQGGGSNGCDSILLITVNEIPTDTTLVEYIGCEGDGFSVIVNSQVYDESNATGIEIMTGSDQCDSIVIIQLLFLPHSFTNIEHIVCQGDSFMIVVNNVMYSESNPNGVEVLVAANGCDSIVTINLVFLPPVFDTVDYHGCSGDGYMFFLSGNIYDEANPSGIDTIEGDCDTIITIDLIFDTLVASLTLEGNQMCASPAGLNYSWFSCDSTMLADTTACITVTGSGCICVIVDNGICTDTICQPYSVCDLFCSIIAPLGVCTGDSVLITSVANASDAAEYNWIVEFDNSSTLIFSGVDSIMIPTDHAGAITIGLEIEEFGCNTFCAHTLIVSDPPLADLCCTDQFCDSAFLSVHLFGQPPFTIAYTDGTTIDTISGITNSQFEFQIFPPFRENTLYTLLWVTDGSGSCEGGIINDSAYVYLYEKPEATILQSGDTLCLEPLGLAYNWTDCLTPATVSPGRCFVPDSSGCYCGHVYTPVIGCADFECIDFVLLDNQEPESSHPIAMWYVKESHAIFLNNLNAMEGIEITIVDLLGRTLGYSSVEKVDDNSMRILLYDDMPSFIVVALSNYNYRYARGIIIPE